MNFISKFLHSILGRNQISPTENEVGVDIRAIGRDTVRIVIGHLHYEVYEDRLNGPTRVIDSRVSYANGNPVSSAERRKVIDLLCSHYQKKGIPYEVNPPLK